MGVGVGKLRHGRGRGELRHGKGFDLEDQRAGHDLHIRRRGGSRFDHFERHKRGFPPRRGHLPSQRFLGVVPRERNHLRGRRDDRIPVVGQRKPVLVIPHAVRQFKSLLELRRGMRQRRGLGHQQFGSGRGRGRRFSGKQHDGGNHRQDHIR